MRSRTRRRLHAAQTGRAHTQCVSVRSRRRTMLVARAFDGDTRARRGVSSPLLAENRAPAHHSQMREYGTRCVAGLADAMLVRQRLSRAPGHAERPVRTRASHRTVHRGLASPAARLRRRARHRGLELCLVSVLSDTARGSRAGLPARFLNARGPHHPPRRGSKCGGTRRPAGGSVGGGQDLQLEARRSERQHVPTANLRPGEHER